MATMLNKWPQAAGSHMLSLTKHFLVDLFPLVMLGWWRTIAFTWDQFMQTCEKDTTKQLLSAFPFLRITEFHLPQLFDFISLRWMPFLKLSYPFVWVCISDGDNVVQFGGQHPACKLPVTSQCWEFIQQPSVPPTATGLSATERKGFGLSHCTFCKTQKISWRILDKV